MELTNNEKLELINSMKIIDDSASCGEMEYVLVEDNEKNREILHSIGLNDDDIKEKCCPDEGCLDLVVVGFQYANAYKLKTKCFFYEDFS